MKPRPAQPSATVLEVPGSSCKCKLCGEPVSFHTVPIIGETEPQRLGRIFQALGKHLQGKHGNDPRFAALMAPPGELATLAMLTAYDTQDLDLLKAQDQIRWKIHQITRKALVSDATIREKVGFFAKDPPWPGHISELVLQLLFEMRDVLMEKNVYPELIVQPPANPT